MVLQPKWYEAEICVYLYLGCVEEGQFGALLVLPVVADELCRPASLPAPAAAHTQRGGGDNAGTGRPESATTHILYIPSVSQGGR